MSTRQIIAAGLLACSVARADLTTAFEPFDGYSGSPGGTPLSFGFGGGGQNGWSQPINGGADLQVYTYGGNALGLNPNPMDAGQFVGGVSGGSPAFPRAQHANNFGASTTWGICYDIAANWLGVGPSAPNLGSVTLQPTAGTPSRYFNAVCNFIDPNNPALGWKAEYSVFDASNNPLNNQSPGPAWTGLAINHWYRQATTIDFITNTITEVSLTDLSTGLTITANPSGWYLNGGAAGNAPLPTDVRFFVGGNQGNVMAWDRLLVAPPTTWYADADSDGFGDPAISLVAVDQPTGFVPAPGDCDDGNPAINPAALEVCNTIDDNCNGQVDEGVGTMWYFDGDGDGFGDPATGVLTCSPPNGYVIQPGDCDDTDPSIYAGAPETCNGRDDNCNGVIDDGVGSTWYLDFDADGYGDAANTTVSCSQPGGYVATAGDCNDGNASIYPGAPETCNNLDDNCNGQVDEGLGVTWYADADGDGYGDAGNTTIACAPPLGYVSQPGDCDDSDAAIHPGALEVCANYIDDNCDGQIDEGCCPLAMATKATYTVGDVPVSVAAGDLNRDGNTDLAVANNGKNGAGSISILLGKPGGTFQAKVNYTAGTSPSSVVIADFNHDGKADVATANSGSNNVSILLGKGDGTLLKAVNYATGSKPSSLAVCDLDMDLSPDLAVANESSNTLSILIGNVDGTFRPRVDLGAGATPSSVAIGDFNRDGRPDLAVANYANNNVSVFLADPALNGQFLARKNYTTGSRPRSVAVADFDADGAQDLAIANSFGNTVSVLPGKGDGTFLAKADYSVGPMPLSVAAADLDGDLLPDIAAANSGGSTVSVLTGQSTGGFLPRVNFGTGAAPKCVIAAQIDHDGRLDLVVATNSLSVLMNSGGTWLWYDDLDGDGYGDSSSTPVRDCLQPPGTVAIAGDCDDANPAVNPGAWEVCDGVDNNCDGNVDENTTPVILQDPADVTTLPGKPVVFSVSAIGATSWQWRKDGVPILGAVLSTYQIASAQKSDEGIYDVLVSSPCGQALSAGAALSLKMPPAAPTNLVGLETSKGTVTLNWKDNAGGKGITGYQVWRAAFVGGAWQKPVLVATISFKLSTYTESPGTGVWRYRVRAANGNAYSTFTGWAPISPASPTGFAIQNVGGNASLSWTDNSGFETSFTIERQKYIVKQGWDPSITLPPLAPDTIQLTDSPGKGHYRYRLRATNAAGSSVWSAWLSISL